MAYIANNINQPIATMVNKQDDDKKDSPQFGGIGAPIIGNNVGGSSGGQQAPVQQQQKPRAFSNIQQLMTRNVGEGQKTAERAKATGSLVGEQIGRYLGRQQQQTTQQLGGIARTAQMGETAGGKLFTAAGQAPQNDVRNQQQQQQLQEFGQLMGRGLSQQVAGIDYGIDPAAAAQMQQMQSLASDLSQNRYSRLMNRFGGGRSTALDELMLQSTGAGEDLAQGFQSQLQGLQSQSDQFSEDITSAKETALKDIGTQQEALERLFMEGRSESTIDDELSAMGISDIDRATDLSVEEKRGLVEDQLTEIQSKLSRGELTQDEINRLGLQDLIGQSIYNLDLGQMVDPDASLESIRAAITRESVVDPKRAARARALQNIIGESIGGSDLFQGTGLESLGQYDVLKELGTGSGRNLLADIQGQVAGAASAAADWQTRFANLRQAAANEKARRDEIWSGKGFKAKRDKDLDEFLVRVAGTNSYDELQQAIAASSGLQNYDNYIKYYVNPHLSDYSKDYQYGRTFQPLAPELVPELPYIPMNL